MRCKHCGHEMITNNGNETLFYSKKLIKRAFLTVFIISFLTVHFTFKEGTNYSSYLHLFIGFLVFSSLSYGLCFLSAESPQTKRCRHCGYYELLYK